MRQDFLAAFHAVSHGTVSFLLMASIAVLTACGVPLAASQDERDDDEGDCVEGAVTEAELDALRDDLERVRGVRVTVPTESCDRVQCVPLSAEQGALAVAMYQALEVELGRYSRAFLVRYGPRAIWLVSDLRSSRATWEAAGIASAAGRLVYLNVRAACSVPARRAVIQHEIYHVLDAHLFPAERDVEAWRRLNPPSFAYRTSYTPGSESQHPQPGFVTDYAMTNASEDRAELYRFQATADGAALLTAWQAEDAFLESKSRDLRRRLDAAWPGLTPDFLSLSRASARPDAGAVDSLTCGGMMESTPSSPSSPTSFVSELR